MKGEGEERGEEGGGERRRMKREKRKKMNVFYSIEVSNILHPNTCIDFSSYGSFV